MITFGSDVADLILQRTLGENTLGLNNSINRMTTGYKVNQAKDNAAGYSIITDLSKKISSMLQVQQNTEDGIALLQTAEGGLEEVQKLLERLRDLAAQASNGTYDAETREAMQAEADQILEQISQIRESIQYDNQNLYYKENNGVQTAATKSSRSLSRASVRVSPLASVLEGAEAFAGGETRTITIDGVQYTVKNKLTTANDLSYSKDTSTGELTLTASNFEIRGQEDVAHNIIISGRSNNVYGGKLNDTIKEAGNSVCSTNNIFAGDGDDTIVLYGGVSKAYGEAGNDILTAYASYLLGGAGDDTLNVYTKNISHYGGVGNDIFNIYGVSNKIYGDDGDDIFNIIQGGSNTIDGGTGTNTVTGTVCTNTTINVIGANSGSVSLTKGVEQVVNINGIDYTMSTESTTATVIYSINDSGQITFSMSSNQAIIKGDFNKKHNVIVTTDITFYGGNKGDTITSRGNNVILYCGSGSNTVISSGNVSKIYCQDGDNTITTSAIQTQIIGGSGTNNITINGSRNYIESGLGIMNLTLNGSVNTVYGIGGNNKIVSNTGSNNFISGFGDADNAQALSLAKGETKEIMINGINYTVKNRSSNSSNALLYTENPVTGAISFSGVHVNVRGQTDVSHNVELYGYSISFYGGDCDDTIKTVAGYGHFVYGQGGNDNITAGSSYSIISGGYGDDVIIVNGETSISGDEGDDIITVNVATSGVINGGSGNDTYNINAKVTNLSDTGGDNIYNVNANNINISGGPGADTFYLSGNNNTVLGAGGDDYFVIDGSNNFIDGGTGMNYYIDNGTGTSFSNVNKDPNAGGISFTYQGEVKTFTLNGKTYTVTNNFAGSNMLQYSLNPNTGVITLNGSNFGVNASSNESAILNIRGNNNVITGSDLSDKITVEQGSNNVINGGKGNDTLIMNSENNSLNGGDGNDNITLNASTNLEVTGGAGADTININSDNNTNISSGAGNDVIKVNGAHNNINTGEGNNSITVNKDNNTINSGDGDNKYVITSSSNTITSGKGNNSIGVQGDDNNITTQNAKGDINIYGNNNTVSNTRGENHVTISGNNNTYSTMTGSKEINIIGNTNNILSGSGDDQIEVKGDNNTIESTSGNNEISIKGDSNTIQGGAGKDNIKINGDNNTANGGAESDSFMVSNGNNNTIDGEGGERNTLIDNGKNTVYTNAVDITPRPFELNIKVDIGSGSDKYISTSISFNLFDFSVDFSTAEGALESLESIDEMLSSVSDQLLNIGNTINRLESVAEAQSIKLNNLISFRSTMRDADIAEESSNYIRYQILQQASATLLASSRNLKAQNVIGLLGSVS
ncbi:MAG: flagellin [Candidatus Gastranaerophilaceae bacterium]